MKSALSRLVTVLWVPVLLSAMYTGWIFWQRHKANRVTEGQPDWNTNPMASYGNTLKILQFYAREREIAPGEKALICYSSVNATAVRLDPPVERVWPAVSRCFKVTPAQSTRYTFTAEDSAHQTVSQSFEIVVKRK
jgi:hypothetical protein